MAQDILAVPVSIVASEACFSIGGRVFNAYRRRLKPNIVEVLICTRDWLYGSDNVALFFLYFYPFT